MKDYLKEELTQEERLIIIGVIWKISRKFKMLYYKERKRYCEFNDTVCIPVEDAYQFSANNVKIDMRLSCPLTDEQKCNIVMNFDSLLRELGLFEMIGTLTFNEKLVFFLFSIEDYKNFEVALLLKNTEKTIFNRRKSIEHKINDVKGRV